MSEEKMEKSVLDAVRVQRVRDLCIDLVRTPTVTPYSGDAQPAGELAGQLKVEECFRSMGAQTCRIDCVDSAFEPAGVLAPHGRQVHERPNVVGTFVFGDGNGPTLLLDAHMDTVAVDRYDGDPFAGVVKDGFIHGRGASDDKGGVSVMIEAVRALLDAGCEYRGRIVCCSVVDEECDGAGRGSLSCIVQLPRPDAAVVIDGSSGGLWNGCTGVVTAEVRVPGRAGHAALGNSVNAIEQAVKLFPAFSRFREARGDRPGDFNLGLFHSGDHPANVPNDARLAMNIKTTLEDMAASEAKYGTRNGRTVRDLFDACIAGQAASDPLLQELPPAVRWIKDVPAARTGSEGQALLSMATACYRAATGEEPRIDLLAGWGDVAHFINAGIPAFDIGAGWPGAAHSASEKVRIGDLANTARTVALLAHRFLREGAAAYK
jgi:acetylornithine deacetylase